MLGASISIATALLTAAAPVADDAEAYSVRFNTALISVCPEAVRTAGQSFTAEALKPLGFELISDSPTLKRARSVDVEVVYVKETPAVCHLMPPNDDAQANARFVTEWTSLAKRMYPTEDLARALGTHFWIPRPSRITDTNPPVDFLLVMGHMGATKDSPETYTASVMAPPKD
jgi:hypothetical protein